ncbi:MAG: FG-GAP-like repeat-containing protein [Myxococcota bacterium]
MRERTKTPTLSAALVAICLAGCGGEGAFGPGAEDSSQAVCVRGTPCDLSSLPVFNIAPALDQSFLAPQALGANISALRGQLATSARVPDVVADLDGNGFVDVLGFGATGTWAVYNFGTSVSAVQARFDFGYDSGWRKERHVRTLADVNGDGRPDIVGFGQAGVYTSLATTRFGTTVYGSTNFVIADFGYDQGWRVEEHERLLGDVDGDGRADIVAFGRDGVWLARSNGPGFDAPILVLAAFGSVQGWTKTQHVRVLADVNGDGRADIVGFGANATSVALSTGTGFGQPTQVIADLGYSQGWRQGRHIRRAQDINGDGRADIVAFGNDGLWVAHRVGNGYEAPRLVTTEFGSATGWTDEERYPRYLTDLNGDGYIDVVGFNADGVMRALGSASGFGPARLVLRDMREGSVRGVGDVDRDGLIDAVTVGASTGEVRWARSTTSPVPPAPSTPTGLRVVRDRVDALDIAWFGSANATQYVVNYAEAGATSGYKDVTTFTDHNITGLHSGTRYCVNVQAENVFGISPKSASVCHTMSEPAPPTSGTFAITFLLQPQGGTGPAFYAGSFGPITGARLLRLSRPPQGFGAPATAVLFPRAGFSTLDCNDPTKIVRLPDGGSLGLTELTAIFGHAPQQGESALLAACYGASDNSLPQNFFVNADWGP